MKSLKLALAAAFVATTALVVTTAAEGPRAPRAAATAVGSPRGLATFPDSGAPKAGADATAPCKTAKKGQCHLPCCG